MSFSGRLVLVRHGQTERSLSGQYTGHTDIALTDHGRGEAEDAKKTLKDWDFTAVYSSPLQRATETAKIVGLTPPVVTSDLLKEWDYGDTEGRRFKLRTATVSLLDIHHGDRVISSLNHHSGEALTP